MSSSMGETWQGKQAHDRSGPLKINTSIVCAHMSFLFPALLTRFPREQAPLLHDQLKDFSERKPLAGVTIVHNVPVTLTTAVKIGVLVAAGADVTVTGTYFVPSDPQAVALVVEASKTCPSIRFVESHAECKGACVFVALVWSPARLFGARRLWRRPRRLPGVCLNADVCL